ncbi:Double zinc ribbon and ankyrin repeat-containing protein 1, partial [Merops nubicus]
MTAGSVSVPQVIPLRIPPPGKAKHEIDTNTLVEIKSDTPEVSIYYTLDGSKPELIRKPGYREQSTFKYEGPIVLPVGKIVVKALAVTKDCRESTVVTKVFLVEYKQPDILFSVEDNDKNFLKDVTTQVSFSNCNPLCEHKVLYVCSSAVTSRKSLASTRLSRIQRETDFLKCAGCCAPRLSDPLANFCQECGSPVPPVPVRRFPSPEGAQMAPCVECRHLVPKNTPTCIVCESPTAPQLQPQTHSCIKGKIICQACGTGNPLHHKHCVTCENKLPEMHMPTFGGDTPLPYHSQEEKTVSCSKCNRVKPCDAHSCDWCGAKARALTPGPPPSCFTCLECGTQNHLYARFCGACGVCIEPTSRVASHNSILMDTGDLLGLSEAKQLQAQVACQPLPIPLPKTKAELKEREDKGTQTIGLFYPCSKLLERKELELISQKEKLEKMSGHRPPLTAISPGKGYWRKQLDHVCAHLRSYAQNNLEFRALIGEPQMGKINSATIREDDYEVIITLNYALAINKDTHTNKAVKFSSHDLNTLREVREGQNGSQTNLGRIWPTYWYVHYVKHCWLFSAFPQPQSVQPPDELGPNGKGRITFLEQLLSEGADLNSISNEAQPGVPNKHTEATSPLVQEGASTDQQSG